jgi:transposase-like protein
MSKKSNRFSPEVRQRAVRMVQEHRGEYSSLWACIESIAHKIGCVPQTLSDWVKRHEIDEGTRDGISSDERERIKSLEREVKELRRANEILKTASAFFAQAELDRRLKS